ncbi:germination protein YpeB [Clostridium novyi]|uniref:Thermolysin metallopeptidase, propeptide n=1 Tax=Clostridium novyi (strain NT) TaxID=386415 RepID=A0Q324_CLONN|nr:germination protein YpeB [Clostridium novyi]ABK62524.1 Thermolysin metallopeptidase, propeptide [Clostridium novyi NT]KEH85455.1 spore gernimation protein [Clostridium novyi A str. 4540]KEH87037.1 spore gernimation protein [Clostridium novyi A str. NCTC 538]KEH91127.1 spore gernimation protein [Clostridium novyi A str. BKT29909]KEH91745.1 spore gernimation protein [Clostridium novyi A str. GD211209]
MNKKRVIYTTIVAFIVVFSTTFAFLMTLERRDYKNYLQGEYTKSMYQLIDSVKNLKGSLAKSAIVNSREANIVTFNNISKYADIANDKIHSIPVSQEYVDGTSKFLAQIGDFAHRLSRSSFENEKLTDKDYETIESLKDQADYLLIQLNQVQRDINEGKLKWGEIRKKATSKLAKSSENLASDKFKAIQNQVLQYPTLINDGPFSENTLQIKPKVTSEKEVTEQDAKNVIKKIFGENKIKNITRKDDPKSKIPSYRFGVNLNERSEGDEIVCEISKNGGHIVYLIDNRKVDKSAIDLKKAKELGSVFLDKFGYKNMKPTYTQKFDNTVTVSYVYNKENINIYPDQIKLKLALDTGEIIGIESEKYLTSHVENRNIPKPKVSKETAMSKIGKNLKVQSTKLAIIPTESNKEILCYEVAGKCKDDEFVVYINAETGYEQRILQIIKTANGELAL